MRPVPETQQWIRPEENKTSTEGNWWNCKEDPANNIHKYVVPTIQRIEYNMQSIRKQHYLHSMMYNATNTILNSQSMLNYFGSEFTGIPINTAQSIVDTCESMISTKKPVPYFTPNKNSNYKDRQSTKKLNAYMKGAYDNMNLYPIGQSVALDAFVFGTGCLYLYPDKNSKSVKAEHVFIDEIIVDELDGANQDPRQIHRRKWLPVEQVCDLFPKKADQIRASNADELNTVAQSTSITPMVAVYRSWHLDDANNGVYCITTNNATLYYKEYKKDNFPLKFFRYHKQTGTSFWGRGIMQQIGSLQLQLNDWANYVQECHRLLASPYWTVEENSNVVLDHLIQNEIGRVLTYFGTPPNLVAPPTIPAELYAHGPFLIAQMYQEVGVSQTQAQGKKPEDVESAVAMEEVADIAQGRFLKVGQDYETFITRECAECVIDITKDMSASGIDIQVQSRGSKEFEDISWKDIDLKENNYAIDNYPISALPQSPQGKYDTISRWQQLGLINSREQVLELLDFPDTDEFVSLETSTTRLTKRLLNQIKDDGLKNYMDPIPEMDLILAHNLAKLEIVLAHLDNVEPEHILLMEQWAEKCETLQKLATPAQPAMPIQAQQPIQGQPVAGAQAPAAQHNILAQTAQAPTQQAVQQ